MKRVIKKKVVKRNELVGIEYIFPTVHQRTAFRIRFIVKDGEIVKEDYTTMKQPVNEPVRIEDFTSFEWQRNISSTVFNIFKSLDTVERNLDDFVDMLAHLNEDGISFKACMLGLEKALKLHYKHITLIKAI